MLKKLIAQSENYVYELEVRVLKMIPVVFVIVNKIYMNSKNIGSFFIYKNSFSYLDAVFS